MSNQNVKFKVVDSGNLYGNMNTGKNFYPANMPADYRRDDFLLRRMIFGNDCGFDGKQVFMPDQTHSAEYIKGEGTLVGTYHILNDEDVKNNPTGWADIPEDIVVLEKNISKGIVGGYPVADCPVVMMRDIKNEIVAISHCSAQLVDIKMPALIVQALKNASKDLGHETDVADIRGYISACAGANWQYDCYPKFAKDSQVWEHSIYEKDGIFYINIRNAILEQLNAECVSNVIVNPTDTITNSLYYSNSAASLDPTKKGRNFIGGVYLDPEYEKAESYKQLIKRI